MLRMLRFSANLGFLWTDRPLVDRIEAAAAAGFGAVECHWPFEVEPARFGSACEAAGVRFLAFNSEPGDLSKGEFGLAALPGREKDFEAGIDRAIAWGRAAGAGAIHVLAGSATPGREIEARATFVRNIRHAAEAAAPHGLGLLLEAMNPRDRPSYFYSTAGEVAALLGEINRPNVRQLFDVYHTGMTEADPVAALRRCARGIGHIQVAGVPARAEPDEGTADYRAVFRAIAEIGYDGWIGCEYRPRTTPEAGFGWLRDVAGVDGPEMYSRD